DRGDLLDRLDPRRVETIRARFGIGYEAVRHELEVGLAPEKRLAAAGQHYVCAGRIDRLARSTDARDGKLALVEWIILVAGRVLDRETRHAGCDRAGDVGRHALRRIREAALEIGIH